ncbi:hypothetical protein K1719_004162 [Acacia pycnantha]|nr:hypothetical protein K1719_004162 [Acacia pycnantha]
MQLPILIGPLSSFKNSRRDSRVQEGFPKSKTIKTRTVGGCLYFLMLFCFQHFPLGDQASSQLPRASVPPSTSFDPDTMLTHPVVRSTYARLLYNLQQEMLALQHTLSEEAQHEGEAAYNQPTTSDESDDDDGEGHDTEEEEHIVEGDDIIDIEEDTQHGEETPTHVDGGLGGEQEVKEPEQDVKEPCTWN